MDTHKPLDAPAILLDPERCMAALGALLGPKGPVQTHMDFAAQALRGAESQLAGFHGEAKAGSMCESFFARHLNSRYQVESGAKLLFERGADGWRLARWIPSSVQGGGKVKSSQRAWAAPLLALNPTLLWGWGEDRDPSFEQRSAAFRAMAEAKLFGIDQPLPGASTDASHPDPANALGYACFQADLPWIRALLAMGADPDAPSAYGKRPLHYCAQNAGLRGMPEAVDELARAGADFRAKSAAGKTPADCVPARFRSSGIHGAAYPEETAFGALRDRAKTQLEARRIARAVDSSRPDAPPAAAPRSRSL